MAKNKDDRWVRELPPPDRAREADAAEVLRLWVVNGESDITLRSDVVTHPILWGGILADFAVDVATMFAGGSHSVEEALHNVQLGFDARLQHPKKKLHVLDDWSPGRDSRTDVSG
ncbi:MAG: DUF5076 domain-containing protein [Planctomycetota bacterium]